MADKGIKKTNAARLLDQLKIAYELIPYEVDEEHLGAEEYEAIFGTVTEDESRIQVCYSLSAATVETIKRKAAELGISASAYIEQLVK